MRGCDASAGKLRMNKKTKVFSASHWGTKRYLFGESWSTALSTWLQLCGATVLPGKGMYGTFVLYHRNGRLRKHNQQISNQLYGAYPSRKRYRQVAKGREPALCSRSSQSLQFSKAPRTAKYLNMLLYSCQLDYSWHEVNITPCFSKHGDVEAVVEMPHDNNMRLE